LEKILKHFLKDNDITPDKIKQIIEILAKTVGKTLVLARRYFTVQLT
jgi:hypothetical protein